MVSAGAEMTGIDIQARTGPVLWVSGKVAGVGPGDKTVSVRLVGVDNSSVGVSIKNTDGGFEFWRVSPGRCE
jgi:hypothetical protein